MQIVKQDHSRSVVEKKSENSNERERKIALNAKARETTATADKTIDVETHLKSSQKFFLGQWASMLDKMLAKPAGNKKPSKATRDAREAASQAFQKYWEENKNEENFSKVEGFLSEEFNDKWELKAHPYKGIDGNESAVTYRWYSVFAGDQDVTTCDWNEVAKKIYEHLYIAQYEKNQKEDKATHKTGLINRKAKAISNNARNYKALKNKDESLIFSAASNNEQRHINSLINGDPDWQRIKETYNLDNLIHILEETKTALNKDWEEKKEPEPILLQKKAIGCHHSHYPTVFKDERGKVIGIMKVKNSEEFAELYRYHNMIKEALIQRYPQKEQSNRKYRQNFDSDELHNLALNIEKNRQMAFAIRLGKVIHYEGGLDVISSNKIKEVVASDFWTSKGQTRIKQNESFVRNWMGAIAIANSTLKHLLDPNNNVNNDVLTGSSSHTTGYYSMLENLVVADFDKQFELLFGLDHGLYSKDNAKERKAIIGDLQETLAQLRHATFHFKKIEDFNEQLDTLKEGNKTTEKISEFIRKNQERQTQLLIDELRSAHVENYLDQKQLDTIWSIVKDRNRQLLPLPKFNKLLLRSENIPERRGKYSEFKLINHANAEEIDKNPSYRCSFISLKMLYEYGFSFWLKQLVDDGDYETINKWISLAKKRATQEADGITGDNKLENQKIVSKMERLDPLEKGIKLEDYFSYLTRETSSVFQVQNKQNTYDSDKEEGRKHSNFVEEFKQDILIQGFKEYILSINDKQLKDLLSPNLLRFKEGKSALNQGDISYEELERPWLYMILYFMPVEFVNHLSLQIRKHHVLTNSEENEGQYENVNKAISLFLGVHNSILGLEGFNFEDIIPFYDENAFHKHFNTNARLETLPIKGLREILRYGNIKQLQGLFSRVNYRVTDSDISSYYSRTESVAYNQNELLTLRKEFKKGQSLTIDDKRDYKRYINDISEHRKLKNHIYLHNHKQAHQLIMQVLGRLAGFSQLWERDIYFVLLTLFLLRGVKPADYAIERKNEKSSTFEEDINNGQIIFGFRKMSKGEDSVISVKDTLKELFRIKDNSKCKKTRIRNDLAHFNSLRKETINLTDIMNETRELMAYDRKLKNAVSRSIIDLLARNNFLISFSINEKHQLKYEKITGKSILHIGDKEITEGLHGKKFVKTIRWLFDSVIIAQNP